MYQFWLGEILLPITPDSVSISTQSKNMVYSLVNGQEINIIQTPKLRTIKFEALIPYTQYPFAKYTNGYVDGDEIKEKIELLKTTGKIFQFVITRQRGKQVYHYTDIRCCVEDIVISEANEYGFDVKIAITLKEYREFGAKLITQSSNTKRQQDNAPTKGNYTIVSGDSLWKIAKIKYGDGSKWRDIYNANTNIISNPNKLKVGMTIVIP